MNIEQAMKLAHVVNVVHHPQGVVVMRNGAAFVARIFRSPENVAETFAGETKGHGKTPDEAFANLLSELEKRAREYVGQKKRDAQRASEEVGRFTGATA